MDRIARLSRTLRWLVWATLASLVAVHLLLWLSGSPSWLAEVLEGAVQIQVHTRTDRLLGLAITLPSTLLTAYGLYRLARMFGRFEAGDVFSIESVGHLRAFGLATLASGAVALLEAPLLGALLAPAVDTPGHTLQFVIRSSDLWTMLIGALMFVIGEIMVEARRIAAENAEIV
jgi:hypothetical protein